MMQDQIAFLRENLRIAANFIAHRSGKAFHYHFFAQQKLLKMSSSPVWHMTQEERLCPVTLTAPLPYLDRPVTSPIPLPRLMSEEPVQTNMDITTGHTILSYMEKHLIDKDMLEQEWTGLEKYEPDLTVANSGAKNGEKNRYADVIPYDHCRVVLLETGNHTLSDYINASFICDHDPRNPTYIATQGPMQSTVPDFWQMVWEQGSVVIVNLTKLSENGESKCARYWPENGSEVYHCYEVHLVSEHIWCTDYLVRSFYLKNLTSQETRTVTQFHFLTWPENGLPASTKSLLDFRRKVNKSFRGRSCPIILHCSDGSGRTGTYCLLDMVLNRINKGMIYGYGTPRDEGNLLDCKTRHVIC
uniref:Uncharacterized protein n=1 Tax=Romanomermis culicivorax TaxID=13658 RepID=A0A915IZN6_ROMCU